MGCGGSHLSLLGRPECSKGQEQQHVIYGFEEPADEEGPAKGGTGQKVPCEHRANGTRQAAGDGSYAGGRGARLWGHDGHDVGRAGRHIHLGERVARQEQGDGQKRLVNEYFPGAIPLTADELAQIRQSGIP